VLRTILTRFREKEVTFITDIEAMFHSFFLAPDHRDFLHFFWFKDNDPNKEIMEYQACMHIFGIQPSPSIAIYSLRKSAKLQGAPAMFLHSSMAPSTWTMDSSVKTVFKKQFRFCRTLERILSGHNICLHKIASNEPEVFHAFQKSKHADGLVNIDL
jgi:hypothetical protein